ncbi:hypothetical protein [Halomonas sp. IOP_31]|uniref:hypothetical protein n=1 Tax=Halomonas sp. IOP_31 TaxID=2876584 RepID=UPI001E2B8379|nr:hypothetical protein [Halomonas sp. IOP_31]MCD6006916.1 hypothetical protein [Halomonas sp. IOP_31]
MGWADSAADGATGGSGGYGGGSDRGGSNSDKGGYSSGFGAEVDTGGVRGGSGNSTPGRSSSGASNSPAAAAETSGYSGAFGRSVATAPSQSISNGTIASMDEAAEQAERSFLDRTNFTTYADTPRSYNATPAMSRAESMVETIADQTGRKPSDVGQKIGQEDFGQMVGGNLEAAYGGVQQSSQPHGLLSMAQNVATGFLGPGGVALDTAIDSVVGGRKAASTFDALNDQYGTSFDAGVATNIGKQAASNTLGAIASMGLSRFGANTGFGLAGVNGARAGGLLGNAAGGEIGDMALSDPGTSPATPANPAQGNGSQGLLASATNQPAAAAPATSYGPADFDGYASYAESFFG